MKQCNKFIFLLICISALTLLFAACKKDKGPAFSFDGFDIMDTAGIKVDHIGPADNDWTFNSPLTDAEIALFDFPVSEDLLNTSEAVLSSRMLVYPNPAPLVQNLEINASDSVLLKLVVADGNLKVLTKGAIKFAGDLAVTLDYSSDSHLFPDGAALRFYYSFSALNKPNFKMGYGDIKICYGFTPGNYMDCF